MLEIEITTEYVTLGKFLKITNLIQSGGEAKIFITENDIYVNGEKENRRGKKLYTNDKIEIIDVGSYQIK